MPSRTASPFRRLNFNTVTKTWCEEARSSLQSRTCPLCRSLRLLGPFEDFTISGEWLHCPDCNFSGDPVQWTAAILRLSIRASLRVLDSNCRQLLRQVYNPQIFRGYLRDYHVQRRHFERLRRDSLVDLPQYEPYSLTRMQWEALRNFPIERPVRFELLGATTAAKVESAFHCRSYRPRPRINRDGRRTFRRGSGPGRARVFAGRDWDETILIPFEDLPGRTAGLYLIRDIPAPMKEDQFFRAVPNELSHEGRREAGLCMLSPALRTSGSQFGRRLFVIYDPEYAVRLQLRHLQNSAIPLPIVGAFADKNAESNAVFRLLRDRELVFWAPIPEMRRDCLIQCCRAQGRYSELPDPRQNRTGTPPSLHLLMSLNTNPEPWDVALRRELRRGTTYQATELLRDLNLPSDRHNQFLRDSAASLVQWMRTSVIPTSAYQRADLPNGVSVVERPEGWFDAATERRLLNVQLRIEEVRHFNCGRKEAEGLLELAGGNSARFVVATDLSGRGFLTDVLKTIPEDVRREIRYVRDIEPDVWRITTTLHPPAHRNQVDYVGLRTDNALHFRRFTLRLGGHVETTLDPHVSEHSPAANLQPPQDLRKEVVARLSQRSRDGRIFWAVAACITHNVLGRLMAYTPRGIGLVGKGAEKIGWQAALVLGCRELTVAGGCTPKEFVETLERAATCHGWPFFVTMSGLRRPEDCRRKMNTSFAAARCITSVPSDVLRRGDYRKWILIRSERSLGTLDYLIHHAQRILPAYLHDLLARRCPRHTEVDPCNSPEAIRVNLLLHDLSTWFELQGGDGELVREAGRLIEIDGHPLVRPKVRISATVKMSATMEV